MTMIHFALLYYSPDTAAMNRLRGYWNVMESRGIDVCVTFLHQNDIKTRVAGDYKYIKFNYFDGYTRHNKLIGLIAFRLHLLQYYFSLQQGDVVYTYGINKVTRFLLSKKDIRVVAEITEHPSFLGGGKTTSINQIDKYETAQRLDTLVVISDALKKDFSANGVESERIRIVNMTVDSSRFVGLNKHKSVNRYVTYCGSAFNEKDGIDELIKAFFIVSRQIEDVRLRIIGQIPSPDDASGNLQMIEEFGIGDRIEFMGQVDYKMIPQMLMDAAVLALDRPDSLQAQYGFPTKLGEYLITGNPVVVTKVGDIPLFLKDGESALFANERDPEDFASKLIWVLNHTDEATAIGEKGKGVALKYFNAEIETDKLIKVLQNK